MKGDTQTTLTLELEDPHKPLLFPILQSGFMVETAVGCSIRDFLIDEMEFSGDTIEKIKTIFLDGKPVDNIDEAIIRSKAYLTFSAAMPGLVGMTLSRGSLLSSFRGTITHREADRSKKRKEQGTIHVKLLNLMMTNLGPAFLQRGIYVNSSLLADVIAKHSEEFRQGCKNLLVNDKPFEPNMITKEILMKSDYIFLSVK